MAEVVIDGLGFRYPDAESHTLEGVDLTIPSGEAHALLGASGAGKSTALALLSGLLTPTEGRILFDGQDVTRVRARDRNVAQVFQFPVLYEGMNVLKNLTFPLTQRGWRTRDAEVRASEVAQALDVLDLLSEPVQKLSLFQKQLVSVGRAIARPDVALVLLDEPLTAVQPSIKWRLRKTLKAAQAASKATMVYVTHDQTEALTFAQTVSVMAYGRLLQTGAGETLYNDPADETVARFVGSPGMNLLDGEVRHGRVVLADIEIGETEVPDGPVRVGVRAEWLNLGHGGLRAEVLNHRPRGTAKGVSVGLADLRVVGQPIQAIYTGTLDETVDLQIARYVLFREDRRVA